MARGRSGQRAEWPEGGVARGRSGQRAEWPEGGVARGRSGQRAGVCLKPADVRRSASIRNSKSLGYLFRVTSRMASSLKRLSGKETLLMEQLPPGCLQARQYSPRAE